MSTEISIPLPLQVVADFVNTHDVEGGHDDLADPTALRAWLAARDLISHDERVGAADLLRTVEFREGLRALLLANAGEPLDEAALKTLNAASRSARLVVRLDEWGGTSLEPDASGIDRVLGRLLATMHGAVADGTWARLKACRKHSCQWAYYDRSKNRSRHWCSMAVCGNRVKAAQYRARERG